MRSYHLTHRTAYAYSAPVVVSRHVGYMTPVENRVQNVARHLVSIDPTPSEHFVRTDYFGNSQLHFQIDQHHSDLVITATSEVTVGSGAVGRDPGGEGPTVDEVRNKLRAESGRPVLDAAQMASPTALTPAVDSVFAFADEFLVADRPYLGAAMELSSAIFRTFEFDPGATDVSTPVDDTLRMKKGVCQDFAHLMLACLRAHGLPARYVSGYILTQPPPGKPKLQGADASHAWTSVFVPGTGWVDLDPTNNLVCGDEHITVAVGRDYADVSPLRGAVVGGGEQEITIEVTMEPGGADSP